MEIRCPRSTSRRNVKDDCPVRIMWQHSFQSFIRQYCRALLIHNLNTIKQFSHMFKCRGIDFHIFIMGHTIGGHLHGMA